MMGWPDIAAAPCGWLADQAANTMVLSSRIRLARNLAGRPFPHHARRPQRAELRREIFERTHGIERVEGGARFALEDLDRVRRQFLGERQLVSQDLVEAPEARGVVIAPDQAMSFMVNEEDHLRIQAIRSGLDLDGAYRAADALERDLDARLEFA